MSRKSVAVPHAKTAAEINRQHRLAKETASQAVDHALACGELLAQVKGEVPRGSFDAWVSANCEFARSSAYAYIKLAGQSSNALDDYTSLRQALGWNSAPKSKPADTPKGTVSVVKAPPAPAVATEETAEERPAVPATPPAADPAGVPAGGELVDDEPTYDPDDAEEDEAIVRAEAELAASIDKVMQSDDRLAAAHAEMKRQAAEIAVLKISRDGFQAGQAEVTRMLQAEQRKTASLQRKLDAAKAEAESLRERIAMMEAG